MELKNYQAAALDAFVRWRDALAEAQAKSETVISALEGVGADVPEDVRNYPKSAWQNLARSGGVAESAGEYASRTDDAKRPIPHVCLKVPTGGGKTLLAAAALERLNRRTGLTLWITPTRAIYQQTKDALRNKEHPYRQMLECASGGRVKLLEKDDIFTRADAANYLCIMLLMLPAANRRKGREFLRMFRDSGRYPSLFPDSDDALGDAKLLNEYPDLERASDNGPVKHSLFNVFKMLRPVVVLDEAHKAYGAKKREANEEFVGSVNPPRPQHGHRAVGHTQPGNQQPAGRHHGRGIEGRGDDQAAGAGEGIDQRRLAQHAGGGPRRVGKAGRRGGVASDEQWTLHTSHCGRKGWRGPARSNGIRTSFTPRTCGSIWCKASASPPMRWP